MLEIRIARPDEFLAAGEATAEAYREFVTDTEGDEEGWLAYLDHIADVAGRVDRCEVWVAVDGGEIFGSLSLELDQRFDAESRTLEPGEAHIRMLGIKMAARGRGVGRALMAGAIERAREAGKATLTLNSTPPMVAGQRLYESLGFVRLPDEVFPDGFHLLYYELTL
jgi:ribosomal protein S18 acetylase RimI-like enzyme